MAYSYKVRKTPLAAPCGISGTLALLSPAIAPEQRQEQSAQYSAIHSTVERPGGDGTSTGTATDIPPIEISADGTEQYADGSEHMLPNELLHT